MTLYFVRHAKAGSRGDWGDADELRPLSKNGLVQAEAIARRLVELGPTALLSSPFLRCRQTLEPLATATGFDVVSDDRLAEGAAFEPVLDLLADLPDGAVLCSHGDVIPDTIAALERRGCVIKLPADWRKGSIWRLERAAGGRFVRAAAWPPPS